MKGGENMEHMLDLSELRQKLDWMVKDGCDVVCVTVNDGSDLQPLSVSFCGIRSFDPNSPAHCYEVLDIRSNK